MDFQIKEKKTLRTVTGILQIVYAVGLFVFSAILMLIFAVVYGIAESLGGEVSANNLLIIDIAKYLWFFVSIILFVNGIMLLTKKPKKTIISTLNIIFLAIVAVFFVLFGGVIMALAVIPVAILVLNILVLINAKKIKDKKIIIPGQHTVKAEEMAVENTEKD